MSKVKVISRPETPVNVKREADLRSMRAQLEREWAKLPRYVRERNRENDRDDD